MIYIKAMRKNGIERLWYVYKDGVIIRDSFNINVIAKFLGKQFNRLYAKRVIVDA